MSLTPEKQNDLQRLGEEVMDIIAKAAGRRLAQAIELVVEEYVQPLEGELARLQVVEFGLREEIKRLQEIVEKR